LSGRPRRSERLTLGQNLAKTAGRIALTPTPLEHTDAGVLAEPSNNNKKPLAGQCFRVRKGGIFMRGHAKCAANRLAERKDRIGSAARTGFKTNFGYRGPAIFETLDVAKPTKNKDLPPHIDTSNSLLSNFFNFIDTQ